MTRLSAGIVRLLLGLSLALGFVVSARADAPTVTAVLTSSETQVDEPVQLQIKITGDSSATPPNDIEVDGLEIHYSGQSQLVEGHNFKFTYSFVYSYTILPQKAGTFTIPPQRIRTSAGVMTTPELTLNVAPNDNSAAAAGSNRNRGGNRSVDPRKIGFTELVVPKTTAYVGEIIPVEIRVCLNARVRSQLSEEPTINGQGFTIERLRQPKQTIESINGYSYLVNTFKTGIAAVHTGKFEIGPVEAKAVVEVPRRSSGNGRSPFDVFGMNDPFSDPFFSDPFGGMMEQREMSFKSSPATLEIKSLPPNAPASFSGAVGNFGLTSDVKPKKVQVGDPLTVTAEISGRGNFDRVNAPELGDTRGWHAYPPSAHFKEDDDIGLSGTKTFEMVLTPNERKSAVPPLVFTYFDPIKEKYVTLKSERLPVLVEGGAAPAYTPAVATASANATVSPTPAPPAEDILYQLTDQPRWGATFAPVFEQPIFWGAQAVPLLGLIGFFGYKTRQRQLADRANRRLAAWEEESTELQKKLRRGQEPVDQYFADALRVVQLKTALARRVEPNSVDAETAVNAFDLAGEKQDQVRELFRRSDELRYSGSANGETTVNESTRRDVSELLESLS